MQEFEPRVSQDILSDGSSGVISQITAQNTSESFDMVPVFTNDEREGILALWNEKNKGEILRRRLLVVEEGRLKELMVSDRARQLIDKFGKIRLQKNQGFPKKEITSKDDVLILLRYSIESILLEDISRDNLDTFRGRIARIESRELGSLKLLSTIDRYFDSYQEAIIAAYPDMDFEVYEFPKIPVGYWKRGDARKKCLEAIRWKIEKDLGIRKEDPEIFRDQIRNLELGQIFSKNRIINGIRSVGYSRASKAVIDTYPELKLKEWEFLRIVLTGEGEAKEETVREAVRWLVEERLGLRPEDPDFKKKLKNISAKDFARHGLGGMIAHGPFKSHITAIILVYKDFEVKEEDFFRFPTGYWQGEEGRQRAVLHTRDLIENKLGLDPTATSFFDELVRVRLSDFRDFGLDGLLSSVYHHSTKHAVIDAYSDLGIKEWQFPHVGRDVWERNNFENIGSFIRWVVEVKLGISRSDLKLREKVLRLKTSDSAYFRIHSGTWSKLGITFNGAMRLGYPEFFSEQSDSRDESALEMIDAYEEVLKSGQAMSFAEFVRNYTLEAD